MSLSFHSKFKVQINAFNLKDQKKILKFHDWEARNFVIDLTSEPSSLMARVNSLPLNTSILKDKTSVSRFKDLSVPVKIPHPTMARFKLLTPGHGRNTRIVIVRRNVVKWQAVLKGCLTFKKFAESEVFYQIVDFLVLYTCSKYIIDRKGKHFNVRLPKLQTVAPNAKSCSEIAEHNRNRPYDSNHFPFFSGFRVSVLCCIRACLHGGGGPQVGEVTRLGGVTRLSI